MDELKENILRFMGWKKIETDFWERKDDELKITQQKFINDLYNEHDIDDLIEVVDKVVEKKGLIFRNERTNMGGIVQIIDTTKGASPKQAMVYTAYYDVKAEKRREELIAEGAPICEDLAPAIYDVISTYIEDFLGEQN